MKTTTTNKRSGGAKLAAGTALALLLAPIATGAGVEVAAGDSKGANGSKAAVPIQLRGAENVGSLQFMLNYDPELLEFQELAEGKLGEGVQLVSDVKRPGVAYLAMHTGASESISGDGVLMNAVFLVKGEKGQSCELRIDQLLAWENEDPTRSSVEMLADAVNGTFTVGGGAGWLLWVAIAVAVLLLLFIILLLAKKKPKAVPASAPQPTAAAAAPAAPAAQACGSCGTAVPAGSKFCPGCGSQIEQAPAACGSCGSELAAGQAFCGQCGTATES